LAIAKGFAEAMEMKIASANLPVDGAIFSLAMRPFHSSELPV
jgi:hypothetical protein